MSSATFAQIASRVSPILSGEDTLPMKTRTLLLFLLTLTPLFAVDASKPAPVVLEPTPLTDQINQNIWIDQMYAGFMYEQCSWFDGEISAYRTALSFVGQHGMRFATDAGFQVWEEQYLLRFVTEAWLFQQYAKTPASIAYYGGAISGYYRVLELMNQWGAYGGPVPGTVLYTDAVITPLIDRDALDTSDYDPFNRGGIDPMSINSRTSSGRALSTRPH